MSVLFLGVARMSLLFLGVAKDVCAVSRGWLRVSLLFLGGC